MTLGYEVSKGTLDGRVANTVIQIRTVFVQVENIAKWLANHPVVNSVDPMTIEPFNYTVDEAYALRLYFETFDQVRIANASTFDVGRKMTGLE